jgi:hypothetical protein
MSSDVYFQAMLVNYLLTVVVETSVLLICLSSRYSIRVKLFAGVWLTACTYPIIWLVMPAMFTERWLYLLAAETFAPVAESVLFWLAFMRGLPTNRRLMARDIATIILANLCSFAVGEFLIPESWSEAVLQLMSR